MTPCNEQPLLDQDVRERKFYMQTDEARFLVDVSGHVRGDRAQLRTLQARIKRFTGRCDFCFDDERPCPDCGPILTGMSDSEWIAEL